MASVEQVAPEQATGEHQRRTRASRSRTRRPARSSRTVPDMSADEVRAMAEKARRVQPGWEALGFEGRGRVLLRAQKWLHRQRASA